MARFNIRLLILGFAVALGLFFGMKWYNSTKHDKTFKTALVRIDSAGVSKIQIYPVKAGHAEITLLREGDDWSVTKEGRKAEADQGAVKNVIHELMRLKPQRLAGKGREKWDEYEVSDSLGTRVKVFEGGKSTADVIVGKFSFKQNPGQQGFRQDNVSMFSYVRLSGEDETYVVEGFLNMTFNQDMDGWRNKTVTKCNREDITEIAFHYPADSGFTAVLRDSVWMIGAEVVPENKIGAYFGKLTNTMNSNFDDAFAGQGRAPVYSITIRGNNMSDIAIRAFAGDDGQQFTVHSSQNPEAYFTADRETLVDRLFVGRGAFRI